MEIVREHLDTYKLRDNEHMLEQSLKKKVIQDVCDKFQDLADQLSIGPFRFELCNRGIRVFENDLPILQTYSRIRRAWDYMNEESFIEDVIREISDRSDNKGYIKLLEQILRDNSIYSKAKELCEQLHNEQKDLRHIDEEFQAWRLQVWEDLYSEAKRWYYQTDSIKPGMDVEVINLKNYKTTIKRVWKIVDLPVGKLAVFKDNTRLDLCSPKIGVTVTWVLAHPEYKPLLSYLREKEQ